MSALLAAALLLPATPAAAADGGRLFDRAALPTKISPRASVLADLDEDGTADLVSAVGLETNQTTQGFSVMLGRPGGGFDPAARVLTGAMPESFQVLDLGDDGHLDVVAVTEGAARSAVVLEGDGSGDLGPPQSLGLPAFQELAVGRFAGGALPGAAIATAEGLVLLRQGATGFAADRVLAPGPVAALLAADLDGDGLDELVAADPQGAITLYRGLEPAATAGLPGVFALHAVGAGPAARLLAISQSQVDLLDADLRVVRSIPASDAETAAAGDLDQDGLLDVVIADGLSAIVHRGSGGQPRVVPLGAEAAGLLVADAGADGHLDVLAVEPAASIVEVIEGDGAGGFPGLRTSVPTLYQATDMAAADFDEDGNVDFVASEVEWSLPNLHFARVYRGNGRGGFAPGAELATDGQPAGLAVGDFNADGHADVAVGDFQLGVSQFLGNGDGTFLPRVVLTPCRLVTAVVAADLDDDGDDDLAAVCRASFYPGFVAVLPGSPAGLLPAFQPLPSTVGGDAFTIDAGDLNGDGMLDLVAGYVSGALVYYLGGANGLFEGFRTVSAERFDGFDVGDLDGDARAEVVVTYSSDDRAQVLRATPAGDLLPAESVSTFDTPYDVRIADLDGDGFRDLVMGHGPNAVSVTPGTAAGLGEPAAYAVQNPVWGDLAVADADEDGRLDVLGAGPTTVQVLLARAS